MASSFSLAAVVLVVCSCGVATVTASQSNETAAPPPAQRLQLWHDIPVASRRLVLDEYAAWLRLNGLNIAGPSNLTSAPLAVTCSLDGDDEDLCESPVAIVTRAASEYSVLLEYPRRVMFGEMATAQTELQKTLDAWLKEGGVDLKKKFGTAEQWQLFVILVHLLYDTIVSPAKSLWLPWLRTLPTVAWTKEHHGIFMTEDEVKCLDVQTKRTQRAMMRDVKSMTEFISSFCRFVNLQSIKGELKEGTDLSQIEITPGTGCSFTEDEIKWAYSVVTARNHQVSVRMSTALLPFIDNMEYRIEANVRPGVLSWVDRSGQTVAREDLQHRKRDSVMVAGVELLASKDLEMGDVLTFRTRYLEPSDALLVFGRHKESDFQTGVQTWVQWDAEDPTIKANNCTTSLDALRMMRDGDVAPLTITCADLHVIRGETEDATRKLRSMHDFNSHQTRIGAFDFLLSHAELALASFPNPVKLPHCFSRSTKRLVEIEKHNKVYASIFEEFRTKINSKKEHRVLLQESMVKAMRDNILNIKQEQKDVAKARLEWVASGKDAAEYDKINPMPTIPEELQEYALAIEREETEALAASEKAAEEIAGDEL